MLFVSNTPGRLGNQILQLLHIMYEAVREKQQIEISKLSSLDFMFNLNDIKENFNKEFLKNNNEKKSHFFPRNLHLIEKRTIDINKYFTISGKYIKPFFKKELFNPLDEKICVIHIRSGDEFGKFKSHPTYVQPPFNYYTKIIDTYFEDYDQFLIVTEPDMLNPCINKLKNYNKKIKVVSNTVEEDYSLLLRAQSLVLSRSSFSDTSVFISPNLKKLFFWNYCHCFSDMSVIPKYIEVKSLILTKPYIKCGEWTHDNKQLELMINYDYNNICVQNL